MTTPQWALEKIQEAKEQKSTVLDLERPTGAESIFQFPEELVGLSHLKVLKLKYNKLNSLPESVHTLRELVLLDLSYNQFVSLPDTIALFQSLETLNLTGNVLVSLPESFGSLHNLITLDLTYNEISDLPESFTFPKSLTELNLSNNRIDKFPESISILSDLKVLNLMHNGLRNLPESLGSLPKLEVLNIQSNFCISLPESIGSMRSLIVLDLRDNHFAGLPESVGNLHRLITLGLSRNRISFLPESISKLQSITTLDLSENRLNSLPNIEELQNITELNLSNNQLIELPESVVALKNLVVLNLSSNKISILPESISQMQELRELDLAHNKLTSLPNSIGGLQNLEILSLGANDFSYIPETIITQLQNLKKLDLSGNPIIVPPLEVATKGVGSIRAYFRQLKEAGQDKLYEAKLLILGEGGAGKTTLAKKIEDESYQLQSGELTTEGVDIIQWVFPLDEDKLFRVNIWDFGGQEIYHATHQFFLTKRSLYILVSDTRKDDTDFYYWLNVIELLSNNSPLLIVKNEKQERQKDVNKRQLQGQFDGLKEILSANLATNRGLNEIKKDIKHYIQRLPHVGSPLPKTWVRVREALEQDERNFIRVDEYLEICKKYGFSEIVDSMQLSGYLHDIGVFLHFQDDALLKHIVILKPMWGTNAVYRVLDNKDVIRSLGRFTSVDIKEIWDAPEYVGMHDELLKLMMKFKLCYEIPGQEGVYIAPQLLTESQPEYLWRESENLLLRYTYEFMPKGILTQFIVIIHPYILEQKYLWKSGVVLERNKSRAEVIEYYGKREIHIRVTGAHKTELMTIIMHEMEKIHTTYKRLKYDKLIPCNCITCKTDAEPYFYRYEVLQKFMEDGQYQIQCQRSYQMVNVRSLVDDIDGWMSEKEISKIVSNRTLQYLPQPSINVGSVNIGGNARVDGFSFGGMIQNSLNKAEVAEISSELKETLKILASAIDIMSKGLPVGQEAEVAKNFNELVDEATKLSPNKKWYSVSVAGLVKAAENIGEVGEPVVKLAAKVLTLLA